MSPRERNALSIARLEGGHANRDLLTDLSRPCGKFVMLHYAISGVALVAVAGVAGLAAGRKFSDDD